MLRAVYEASGRTVHADTSPHLVRYNERFYIAGKEIEDAALVDILEECECANAGTPITHFEITTAAAFLAFSRVPADILLLEVGLGGRFDTTNVIDKPAVSVITPISMDHMAFLGDTVEKIAFEKAGILKPRVPAVIGPQEPAALAVIKARAAGSRRASTATVKNGQLQRAVTGCFSAPAARQGAIRARACSAHIRFSMQDRH